MTISPRAFRAAILVIGAVLVSILVFDQYQTEEQRKILDDKAQALLNDEQEAILKSLQSKHEGDSGLITLWRTRFPNPSRDCLDELKAIDNSNFAAAMPSAIAKCDQSVYPERSWFLWWAAAV